MTLHYACEQMTSEDMIVGAGCSCDLDKVEDLLGQSTIDDIIDSASDAVAVATSMRVTGRCTDTVRPCSDGVCGCPGRCACCDIDGVKLPGPNITVTQVKVDGAVVDPALYNLVDGDVLVRWGADSGKTWPGWQVLTKPDTEADTFSITFTHGHLPWVARMAATEIACDLLTGVTPGGQMKLPKQTVAAIMDNVTLQLDPSLLQGLAAFPWMERLFATYPAGPQPIIYSPEIRGRYTLHTVS